MATKLDGSVPYIPGGPSPVVETQAEEVSQMTVDGTVQKQQFQSILFNEVYTHKAGHSAFRTGVVGVLALPLFPLLALYDLVRYGLFEMGKCDGKSWSLIDKASELVRSLSSRVDSTAQTKFSSIDEQNLTLEQAMKAHVEKIVDGYRKAQGGWIGKLFDSSKAIEGEKQLRKHQGQLVGVVADYLNANVSRSEEFAPYFSSVKDYIRTLFVEIAQDDIYVESKVERKGPRPFLSETGIKEFESILNGHLAIARAFLTRAESDLFNDYMSVPDQAAPNFLSNLKRGVVQGLITSAQAREKVQEHARGIYGQAIAVEGPKAAASSVRQFLEDGIQSQLFSPEEAAQIYIGIQATPKELASAVVQNVVQFKERNPTVKPATVDQLIANAAYELKRQGKLSPNDEIEFLNEAKDQLSSIETVLNEKAQEASRAQQEAEAAANLKADQEAAAFAAFKARQELEALEAVQKAAEVQKIAAERQNLFDVLRNFLNGIGDKQKELLRRYGIYDAQAADKAEFIKVVNIILQAKVHVGKDKKEMTVLQAYEYRSRKINEINASNKTPDEIMIKTAQFDQDFGADAVAVIAQLHTLEAQVTEITKAMSTTLKSIDTLDLEIGKDIATYKGFARTEKKRLEIEQRAEVVKLEKSVFGAQEGLNDRYRKVHHLSAFADLPSEKVEAAQVNVEDYMTRLVEKQPSLASRLWNGVTAPFAYAARTVGLSS